MANKVNEALNENDVKVEFKKETKGKDKKNGILRRIKDREEKDAKKAIKKKTGGRGSGLNMAFDD